MYLLSIGAFQMYKTEAKPAFICSHFCNLGCVVFLLISPEVPHAIAGSEISMVQNGFTHVSSTIQHSHPVHRKYHTVEYPRSVNNWEMPISH